MKDDGVTLKRIAPLQLMVIGFMHPQFEGNIIAELDKLRENKMIRIVDALSVDKADDGEITIITESDLTRGETAAYQTIINWLIGLDSGDETIAKDTALSAAMVVDREYEYGIDQAIVDEIISDIPKGGAAAFLLVEHLWALPLKDAVRQARGVIIAQDFLNPETLVNIGATAHHKSNTNR